MVPNPVIAGTAVWHFSFTVSDLDRAVRFYVELLGFECVYRQLQDNNYTRRLVGLPDAVLEIAQLRFAPRPGRSGHDLELVQYRSPRHAGRPSSISVPGAAHLAIEVEDAVRAYERLAAHGVVFVSAPNEISHGVNTGGRAAYFYGPDQIVHELVQPPRSTGAAA